MRIFARHGAHTFWGLVAQAWNCRCGARSGPGRRRAGSILDFPGKRLLASDLDKTCAPALS